MIDTSTRYNEAEALFDKGSYSEALKIFKELADNGNAEAQCQAGYLYSGSCDQELRNDKESYRYAKLAADQGHRIALSNLGYCLANGVGCKQDLYLAAHYQRRAIELGYKNAHNHYGFALERGNGVNKTISGAMRSYRIAADCGNKYAVGNIQNLEHKFKFDANDNIEIKATNIGKWQKIFLLILLAIAFFIVEFAIDNDDPIVRGIIFSHWITSLCIALMLLKLRLGGWLFKNVAPIAIAVISALCIISVAKSSYSLNAFEGTVAFIAAYISWFVTYLIMQIKNDGIPYWNTLMNIPYDGNNFFRRKMALYFDYGYGDKYLENSAETAKFKELFNILTIAIAALSIASIALIFISDGHVNFHLEWNFFNSWAAGFLYAIGLVLTLTQSLSIFQTWFVFKDSQGNEKGRKRSTDLTDAVSDGFIMPLLQRFVAYPLGIAIPVYYIIVFALSIFEPIMPFLFVIIFALIAINYRRQFIKMSRRLNRGFASKLLAGCNMLLIVVLSILWLFFSVNKFTPEFGMAPAKREYNELSKIERINEVKNLASTYVDNIKPSIDGVYDRFERDTETGRYNFYKNDTLMIVANVKESADKLSISSIKILSDQVPTDCRVRPGSDAKYLLQFHAQLNKDDRTFSLDRYDIEVEGMAQDFYHRVKFCREYKSRFELIQKDFTTEAKVVSLTYKY